MKSPVKSLSVVTEVGLFNNVLSSSMFRTSRRVFVTTLSIVYGALSPTNYQICCGAISNLRSSTHSTLINTTKINWWTAYNWKYPCNIITKNSVMRSRSFSNVIDGRMTHTAQINGVQIILFAGFSHFAKRLHHVCTFSWLLFVQSDF